MEPDINKLAEISSQANEEVRLLKATHDVYPERCDVMYVLYIFTKDCTIKIGRTTLFGFERRMKEHSTMWSDGVVSLVTVRKITHWTDEEKFHKHMRTFQGGIYRRVMKIRGKSFDEFYENNHNVLEELYRFIG
jgi:hypothetical protein